MEAEAKTWMQDAKVAIRRGRTLQRPTATLKEACEAWLEGARSGAVRTRSGDIYKPATVRAYGRGFRLRVYSDYGAEPVTDLRRADLQALVDQLVADGVSASTVQVTIMGLQAVMRHEVERDRLKLSPAHGLGLPAARGRRERVATPAEAAKLLAALPIADRAIWATAFYGGLRRGELMALRADAVDLDAGEIRVVAGWDPVTGRQET